VIEETEVDLKPININNGENNDSDNENKEAKLLYNSDK
jgi:hypothetical protein